MTVASLTLPNGAQIPMQAFGSGTAHFMGKRTKIKNNVISTGELDRDIVDAVKTALQEGYRHLDCAELYGTEQEVGAALRESMDEGIIKDRGDVFITSKVEKDPVHEAEKAIDRALERLGDVAGGYVDLPYFANSDSQLQQAWAAMERIHATGKAKSIGVSNYEPKHIDPTLATAKIRPVINQIEFHPYMTQQRSKSFLDVHRKNGIAVSAYGVIAPVTRNIPGPLDGVLERLSSKYGQTPGSICMRWCIEQDIVVITTSQKPARMREYLQVFEFSLTNEEVEEITAAGIASLGTRGDLKTRMLRYLDLVKAGKL